MNNKSKFRFAILFFGVLSAFISTSCSGDNNGSLPDDPSQGRCFTGKTGKPEPENSIWERLDLLFT